MANEEHVTLLRQGVEAWNAWREQDRETRPDLSGANLHGANLYEANLYEANLFEADLSGANLSKANLSGADLIEAYLSGANLREAHLNYAYVDEAYLGGADLRGAILSGAHLLDTNLSNANLSGADFYTASLHRANLAEADLSGASLNEANLVDANFNGADLTGASLNGAVLYRTALVGATLLGASLERAILVETDLTGATLTDCNVYGISAWAVKLGNVKQQSNLRVTPKDEPEITVDNIKVAQFIYLMLHNEEIRDVIDTIGEKGVLILGRFTRERKAVLDAIRNELREFGFVPMMFDFEKPTQRDFTETIKTLAGMSRFIIADITNPKSSPLELQAIMPDYMIPFVPIIHQDEEPFAMFRDLKQKYGDWVLDVLTYDSVKSLIKVMEKAIIAPAIEKADQLLLKKTEEIRKRHVRDYM